MITKLSSKQLEEIIKLIGKAYQTNIDKSESDFTREAKNQVAIYLQLPDLFNYA
jgi:hypothetical protein